MAIDQTIIDKIKAEHAGVPLRKLSTVDPHMGGDIEIIVRAPTGPEYKKFRTESASKDQNARAFAVQNIVAAVVLYPPRDQFNALMARLPGICEEFSDHIAELAGLTGQARSEKL